MPILRLFWTLPRGWHELTFQHVSVDSQLTMVNKNVKKERKRPIFITNFQCNYWTQCCLISAKFHNINSFNGRILFESWKYEARYFSHSQLCLFVRNLSQWFLSFKSNWLLQYWPKKTLQVLFFEVKVSNSDDNSTI